MKLGPREPRRTLPVVEPSGAFLTFSGGGGLASSGPPDGAESHMVPRPSVVTPMKAILGMLIMRFAPVEPQPYYPPPAWSLSLQRCCSTMPYRMM